MILPYQPQVARNVVISLQLTWCVTLCTCCILSCLVSMAVNCPGCICSCLVVSWQSYEYLLFYVCIVVILVVLCVYCCRICCTMCELLYVCVAGFTVDAELLARSQYSEGPATGHFDTDFSCFPCVYKQMLRWLPRFQVATTCFSCSPPDLNLNLSVTSFIFCFHVK